MALSHLPAAILALGTRADPHPLGPSVLR